MGKRGGKRGRGRDRGGNGGGRSNVRIDYPEIPKSNELFEKYYSNAGFVSDEEIPELWRILRRELPNSFRFTGSRGHALPVQQLLKNRYIPEITSINYEGRAVEPPSPLPWYPDELAWQMTTPKNVIRRFPPFSSFQKFLVSETFVGNISRQEAVSMIPPLLLDVRPGMTVLDLCAAPGSKSAQLLEMVHTGEEARTRQIVRKALAEEGRDLSPDGNEVKLEENTPALGEDWSDDGRATGLLIANDIDYKRAHMLIHQMKRLSSPNLIVTNHDASMYPSIKLPPDPAAANGIQKNKYLKFNRILADVPCSGDGTARKNLGVWRTWTPANAHGLHLTQIRILVRSLQMLKAGGLVCYSTCSMNPVENESVVAAAIERCGGLEKIEIVDCSSKLPELKRAPGLNTWKIMDKKGNLQESWKGFEDAKAKEEDEDFGRMVAPTMFPPDASKGIPLERCVRVYPHFQDTGGFFITILRKKSEIRARPENDSKEQQPKGTATKTGTVPPITAALEELESKVNGDKPGEHIESLDALAPPEASNVEPANPGAAERSNSSSGGPLGTDTKKHTLDEDIDEEVVEATAKRSKLNKPSFNSAQSASETPSRQAQPGYPTPTPKKKEKSQPYEDPYKYLDSDHEALDEIFKFYDINPRFPRDRFMVRNAMGVPSKTIYYTSTLARDILQENEGKGHRFVHCGIKMFVRQDVQHQDVCRWRVQTDGLSLLEAWVGESRVMRLKSRKTFRELLVEMFPKVGGGSWKQLGEIGERARDISMGCCVLRIEKGEGEDSFNERMVLPIWRSLHSLNLMLPKEDRKAMLLRLYNDTTPLQDHSKDRFVKQGATANTSEGQMELDPSEAAEKEDVAAEEEAAEKFSEDEEDGGVKLHVEDVEKETDLKVEMELGIKDEDDVKEEVKEEIKEKNQVGS